MEAITTTLTITMAMVLNMQECHCDGLCGVGPSGSQGPYQILSFGQMEKLGYPKDDTSWWMDFYEAQPAVQSFLHWLEDTIPCSDPRWTYAAWNWGIGNVLRHIEINGCDLGALPWRVYSFANLERGRMCFETRRDEWRPMTKEEECQEMNLSNEQEQQEAQDSKPSLTTLPRSLKSRQSSGRQQNTLTIAGVRNAWIGGLEWVLRTTMMALAPSPWARFGHTAKRAI
jgi:hypothetical protein